jgi:predicted N-acetyltransferase YhbS
MGSRGDRDRDHVSTQSTQRPQRRPTVDRRTDHAAIAVTFQRLTTPFPPAAFMALDLAAGALDGVRGAVRHPAAFQLRV